MTSPHPGPRPLDRPDRRDRDSWAAISPMSSWTEDYQVRASTRATSSLRWLEGKPVEHGAGRFERFGRLRPFPGRNPGLIHCAGVVSAPSEEIYQAGNVTSTACLLEAAEKVWASRRFRRRLSSSPAWPPTGPPAWTTRRRNRTPAAPSPPTAGPKSPRKSF